MPSRRQFAALLPLLVSLGPQALAAGPGLALTTILDGEARLVRDNSKFTLVEGVQLQAEDILEVAESARLLRIEFADGVRLDLGPAARLLLAPRLAGARGQALAYLLRGWAKVTVPPKAPAAALLSPVFDASTTGNAVVALLADGAQVFAEAGEVGLRFAPAVSGPLELRQNQWLGLAPGTKPSVSSHPGPAFVQQVPRAFLDPLPSRAALFAGKLREPKRVGDLSYADAQPWIDNPEAAMRKLALQRWRSLAKNTEFRAGLLAGLKAHPEWQPVLFPPVAASAAHT